MIYIKDIAGNVFPIPFSSSSLPSEWYDDLCRQRGEEDRDRMILLADSCDDPYDMSPVVDESILHLVILDEPFRERWGSQKTIVNNHMTCDYIILYWDCDISAYNRHSEDAVIYQTHWTAPLYIVSKRDGTGFFASSWEIRFLESVNWSNTLREALVHYQIYTNKGKKEGSTLKMTDEVVDHMICLWHKYRRP